MEITIGNAEKRLEAFTGSFDDMDLMAKNIKIDSEDTMAIGNELIAKAKGLQNKIEAKRVSIYDEIYPKDGRKVVKATNALAKTFKERLAGIINTIDGKYMTYRRKLQVAEAKRQIEVDEKEAKAKEEREKLFIPPTVSEKFNMPAPVELEKVANVTKSDSGSSYIKKIKGFRVTDFSKVPDSYKMLDEVHIRQVMNSNDRHDIPGIEWTLEEKRVTRLS